MTQSIRSSFSKHRGRMFRAERLRRSFSKTSPWAWLLVVATLSAGNALFAQGAVRGVPGKNRSGFQRMQKPSDPNLLFVNSDFEKGDLTNWTASGSAFDHQPTKGDNPTVRTRHQPAQLQGQYWIGTFEKYQGGPNEIPGQRQGDRPTGSLTSVPFTISRGEISFLVGGGRDKGSVNVALVVDGREVMKASGRNHESMRRETWDVSAFLGKTARIRINDQSIKGWGHINADDFRYGGPEPSDVMPPEIEGKPSSGPVFPNSDFENGDLTNWTASGSAFDHQPTKGDNPTARTRHQPAQLQGQYWIGTFEKYQGGPDEKPGQRQGDQPTGTLESVAFQIDFDRMNFLIGGGNQNASVYVALVVEGREVLKATGRNSETMTRQSWDVSAYRGQSAKIRICDQSSKGWGHINADDFRYENP